MKKKPQGRFIWAERRNLRWFLSRTELYFGDLTIGDGGESFDRWAVIGNSDISDFRLENDVQHARMLAD